MSIANPAVQAGTPHDAVLDGLARWALARSGVAEVARVLRMLTAAALEGQLGPRLHDDALLTAAGPSTVDLNALRASGWLTEQPEQDAAPIVLDRQRLYLWRHQRAEVRVAAQLLHRAQSQHNGSARVVPEALLPAAHLAGEPAADQAAAICQAGSARLLVLTGGPGTGKTTTVLRLLLALLAQSSQPAQQRIALAAPTGKAAQRLAEAVIQGKLALAQALPPPLQNLLDGVPEQASTLHSLLEFLPTADRFRRDADDPLALDVLVVDEASMVDLHLMDAVLSALPDRALLILVGDPDQLVSVAVGTVLADLVSSAPHSPVLAAVLSRLQHVWRASDALVELPRAIRAGDIEAVRAQLGTAQIQWAQPAAASALLVLQQHWLQTAGTAYLALAASGQNADAALQALPKVQVLCAVREGPFGVVAFNAAIATHVRRAVGVAPDTPWYRGRVVMLTHNQHALKLYNGDIGITLADADGQLAVWFPGLPDSSGARLPRRFHPRQLSDLEDAWAITVHKSQGSEYAEVLLVLPPDPAHRLLSRELLYTAVTRARAHLHIWATAASLYAAVSQPVTRSGGLGERLLADN